MDDVLADLLVQRHWLTTEDRADVERLLERKLRKQGSRPDVEPWRYLRDVLVRLPSHPPERLGEPLPDVWARAQRGAVEAMSMETADQMAARASGFA